MDMDYEDTQKSRTIYDQAEQLNDILQELDEKGLLFIGEGYDKRFNFVNIQDGKIRITTRFEE